MSGLRNAVSLMVILFFALLTAFLYFNIKTHHSSYGYVPGYEASGRK